MCLTIWIVLSCSVIKSANDKQYFPTDYKNQLTDPTECLQPTWAKTFEKSFWLVIAMTLI